MPRSLITWLALALGALLVLPWHQQEAGFWSFEWLRSGAFAADEAATCAALLILRFARLELLPLLVLPPLAALCADAPLPRPRKGTALVLVSLAALGWLGWLGWGRSDAQAIGLRQRGQRSGPSSSSSGPSGASGSSERSSKMRRRSSSSTHAPPQPVHVFRVLSAVPIATSAVPQRGHVI